MQNNSGEHGHRKAQSWDSRSFSSRCLSHQEHPAQTEVSPPPWFNGRAGWDGFCITAVVQIYASCPQGSAWLPVVTSLQSAWKGLHTGTLSLATHVSKIKIKIKALSWHFLRNLNLQITEVVQLGLTAWPSSS